MGTSLLFLRLSYAESRKGLVGMALLQQNGYGPAGLANSVYVDPYGGSVARPARRISMSPESKRTRRRIARPPHDWTATTPHPSGNHLSTSGTWRKGYMERHNDGVAEFRDTVTSLLEETRPEPPPDNSVRLPTRSNRREISWVKLCWADPSCTRLPTNSIEYKMPCLCVYRPQ